MSRKYFQLKQNHFLLHFLRAKIVFDSQPIEKLSFSHEFGNIQNCYISQCYCQCMHETHQTHFYFYRLCLTTNLMAE